MCWIVCVVSFGLSHIHCIALHCIALHWSIKLTNTHVYIHMNDSTAPWRSFVPAVVMVYTDIQTLRGLSTPIDYGSGVEYGDGLVDSLFHSSGGADGIGSVGLQIGLWLNGTAGCHDIVNGVLDMKVHQLVTYLQHTTAPKVFLRVGYEFDNPSFGYDDDPGLYRSAYRYLYRACQAQTLCASKTLFVWHSWAAPRNVPLLQFYPGDDYVDWIGVSVFQQVYDLDEVLLLEGQQYTTGGSSSSSLLQEMREVFQFASSHNKPTMIAESTPFGGITTWDRWYQPTLDLINEYDIGMWCYINCDWESQPMWHNVGFGETRLSTNNEVMDKWNGSVLNNPHRHFLMAGSLLEYCGERGADAAAAAAADLGIISMMMMKPQGITMKGNHIMIGLTFGILIVVLAFIGWVWRNRLLHHHEANGSALLDERMVHYGSIVSSITSQRRIVG